MIVTITNILINNNIKEIMIKNSCCSQMTTTGNEEELQGKIMKKMKPHFYGYYNL